MEDDKKYELINFTFHLLQDTLQHFMFFLICPFTIYIIKKKKMQRVDFCIKTFQLKWYRNLGPDLLIAAIIPEVTGNLKAAEQSEEREHGFKITHQQAQSNLYYLVQATEPLCFHFFIFKIKFNIDSPMKTLSGLGVQALELGSNDVSG